MSIQVERRQLWESRIDAFRASGQKAAEWCAENQINRRQLYNWMRRLDSKRPTKNSPSWVRVKVDQQPQEASPSVLIKIGSATIEVKSGYDASLLADVVRTLQTIC
ncbi:helix-turn-helix domain-containing protein [Paenibacillus sp. JMULE4]|uniref:IS66 family insertion sequence element accessory protein TnpA n=1 Tax=Paenibacillus sp. JMULE4 TaxID=2518342 RepID=UPI0015764B67|nr:helix-turn-helix domain-containing protein [Paenibacillus sp. JMULE4]NTZ20724.1 helix-turn-helix domain-containing protein [Paenibacillus sp. JMULE4]NTZ20793.1 helix-turn-helix domain-containing protein [Paenibacillus sp. JMULE4]